MPSSEAQVQADIRLAAAQEGVMLWRNNSGALPDQNGRTVRFGLGNDSKAVNEQFKSPDLVGIRPLLITQEMVGQYVGQFISLECKDPTFRGPAGDTRAEAQARWNALVTRWYGVAGFASNVQMARNLWGSGG